jgi:hypothetical protein
MIKYSVILILILGFAAYCVYAVFFFAWAATAPAEVELHERARVLARVWSAGLFVSLALAVGVVWRMVRIFRTRRVQS